MIRSLFSFSGDLNVLDKYKLFEIFPLGSTVELSLLNQSEVFMHDEV